MFVKLFSLFMVLVLIELFPFVNHYGINLHWYRKNFLKNKVKFVFVIFEKKSNFPGILERRILTCTFPLLKSLEQAQS